MRTYLERVSATDAASVRDALELWKSMRRAGWELTVLHRYKPTPTLIAFGYVPTDDVRSSESLANDATSDDDAQLSLFASDSPER